jgi:hypothetical protein
MKVKNNEEFRKFVNFKYSEIIEYCDGAIRVTIPHVTYLENGFIHRENGPAVEWWIYEEDGKYKTGEKRWCLNDSFYSEEQWEIKIKKLKKISAK